MHIAVKGLLISSLLVLTLLPSFMRAQAVDTDTTPRQETVVDEKTLGYGDALVLGAVEGITEYLPISSTGHLILTNRILGLDAEAPLYTDEGTLATDSDGEPYTLKRAADAYAIIIQGGAIIAVVLLYWRRLWSIGMGFLGRDVQGLRLGMNLIIAFLPAAVLGLLFDDLIETYLFGIGPVVIALVGGAILMLLVERWRSRNKRSSDDELDLSSMTPWQALLIGLMQCVAMWPGTSRSMMTIVGGYVAGLSPRRAAEFSFLLGLITLTAASGYKLLKDGPAMAQVLDLGPVLFGCFVATIAAALSVKWLVGWLSKHGLTLFAWYRLILAAAVFFVLGV